MKRKIQRWKARRAFNKARATRIRIYVHMQGATDVAHDALNALDRAKAMFERAKRNESVAWTEKNKWRSQ